MPLTLARRTGRFRSGPFGRREQRLRRRSAGVQDNPPKPMRGDQPACSQCAQVL
ncbi:hypothetical protein [Streptomyces sp. SID13031]|uniref:hypothetical protein n=1 Tax=Streptomyces sp. SID13031 TaxID=2706046 RepID=UPI0013CAB6B8|nr:hypothetical protein [Streptomyces sp. SID13031]NEA35615.1 hypothetical protein [Streptomyces sp. SID13031]